MPSTKDLNQADPVVGRVPDAEPCIDFREIISATPAARQRLREQVRLACLETGFLYLSHAFEDSTVKCAALAQMQRFFSLDDKDPRKIAVDNRRKKGTYGWMPLYGEPAYQPGTFAHVESFDCGRENQPSSIKWLEGKNVWPDLPGFRSDIRALWDRLAAVGNAVLEIIAESAGIERDFFSSRCNSHALSTLRLLHYPGGQSEDPRRDVGIAAHTDFECVSLILQTGPGLELTNTQGRWYDAPASSDTVVVLLDDMLERWTNGFFKATGHRVRRPIMQRYSVVLFVAANPDQVIAPLEQFVTADNPAQYAPISQRQHIDAEVKRSESYRAEAVVDPG
jgi:isopenicillin N synthase-like dioxygenase